MSNSLLILIQGREVAASRYRILQYIPYLQEHGVICTVREFPRSPGEYISLSAILSEYDCVFVQRKRFHFPFLTLFCRQAKRVVYDLDDAVMFKNTLAKFPYSRTRERRFRNMVCSSDVIIAGNTFLQEQASRHHSRVMVIPTSIPAQRYCLKDYTRKKERITIGWIGDHGSIHYLKRIKDIFEEIGRRFSGKVELKIVCDTFIDCSHIPVRKVRWSQDTEVAELMDMDIGVMPLVDDPWSWGKCGLKILQYFGVGVPAVCTPVGVNRDVVVHGHNGFWANSPEEWIDALSTLVINEKDRKCMGLRGRMTLESGYTMEANSSHILSSILGNDKDGKSLRNGHWMNTVILL
jgi:glycosyltransferase involved in cell wall biosynthesis